MGTNTRVYSNIQNGSPTLSGTPGDLKVLLHAVLFGPGYGEITPDSIIRSGSTATLTRSVGHGFIDGQVIEIAGATQSEYNGYFRIIVINANELTFQVTGSPVSPATGTITVKTPSVGGWNQRFDATDKTILYSQDISSSGLDFRFDDTGTSSARLIGYESTSDIDTGTNPFPTDAQVVGGSYVIKSSAASSATRPWCLVASPTNIYMSINTNGASLYWLFGFGDISTPYPSYPYRGWISAADGNSSSSGPHFHLMLGSTDDNWVARSHTNVVGSIVCRKRGPISRSGVYSSGSDSNYTYPSPLTPSGVLFGTGSVKIEIAGGDFLGFIPGIIPIMNKVDGSIENGVIFRGVTGFPEPIILLNSTAGGCVGVYLGDW